MTLIDRCSKKIQNSEFMYQMEPICDQALKQKHKA
jgi:hypothetical protein